MKFALIVTALISMAFCNVHAVDTKIDLLGPMKSTILSTVPSDFSVLYKSETPTWVLGSLIKIEPNQ